MSYRPHTVCAFGGTISNGPEIWETRIALATIDDLPVTNPAAWMNAFATPLATWFMGANNCISSTAQLAWLKVNNVDEQGRQTNTPTNVHDYSPVATGGGGAPVAPCFVTAAITFKTGKLRPPGAWGRIYPPNFTLASVSGAHLSAGDAQKVRDSGKALLSAIANVDLTVAPVLASKVDGSLRGFVEVSADDVWDTQRRRKNRLVRTRYSSPWP